MSSFWSRSPELSSVDTSTYRKLISLSLLVISWLSLLISAPGLFAQQKPTKPVIEEKELLTKDDLRLKISYFKSTAGAEAPVVIMLHGKRGTRLQWKAMASDLQQKDFAVITVDLRGHGESPLPKKGELRKTDYQAMVALDLEAVKEFLLAEHSKKNLNMNKLGIVACEFSASVAILFTELDWEKIPFDDSPTEIDKTPRGQDVQALALISPDATTPGLSTNKAIAAIRNLKRPIVIAVGDKNAHDLTAANKIFDQFIIKKDKDREKEEPPYLWKYEENFSGMDLVTKNVNVRNHITAFLTKYVKEYKSDWKDRRSRLDRD